MPHRSPDTLLALFESSAVVDLEQICSALDDASRATAFRYLRQVPYRRSYNQNGRYYTHHSPSRYDRFGLFSYGDIHFSVDRTLKATVRRLVEEAEAGWTQRELGELLRVQVQSFLLQAVRAGDIARTEVRGLYVYLHGDAAVRQAQLERRRQRLEGAGGGTEGEGDLNDTIIIQVLLVLIRHPGSRSPEVVRHLQGHSPPITLAQVVAVFARYELGEKGGHSKR